MRRGLFDRLLDPAAIDPGESIVAHLESLFNHPTGACPGAPSLGVTSMSDIVHALSESTPLLERAMRAAILRFEARIEQVQITQARDTDTFRPSFWITARLCDHPAHGLQLRCDIDQNRRILVRRISSSTDAA